MSRAEPAGALLVMLPDGAHNAPSLEPTSADVGSTYAMLNDCATCSVREQIVMYVMRVRLQTERARYVCRPSCCEQEGLNERCMLRLDPNRQVTVCESVSNRRANKEIRTTHTCEI